MWSRWMGWIFACGVLCGSSGGTIPRGEPGAPVIESQVVRSGPLRQRLSAPDDADLVILYGGEQHGVVGLCGCETALRGSLGRFETLADRTAGPTIRVNVGRFLSSEPAERMGNETVLQALDAGAWDALNLTPYDLQALSMGLIWPSSVVSTNLRGPVPIPTEQTMPLANGTVQILGISAQGDLPEGWTWTEPLAAIDRVARSDALVVVLAHGLGRELKQIAAHPDVDVVIAADGYRSRSEGLVIGSTIWVRSQWESVQLGELRLALSDGRVLGAIDRKVDLDRRLPVAPELRGLQ